MFSSGTAFNFGVDAVHRTQLKFRLLEIGYSDLDQQTSVGASERTLPTMPRPRCTACLRPPTSCICGLAVPTPHATEVLILQHPLEVLHAKNTARLLHLSLPGSRIVVGEAFDAPALQALMPPPKYTVLLYPPKGYPLSSS